MLGILYRDYSKYGLGDIFAQHVHVNYLSRAFSHRRHTRMLQTFSTTIKAAHTQHWFQVFLDAQSVITVVTSRLAYLKFEYTSFGSLICPFIATFLDELGGNRSSHRNVELQFIYLYLLQDRARLQMYMTYNLDSPLTWLE